MSELRLDPKAKWIWCAAARRTYNNFVCFRRAFTLKTVPKAAALRVTADARYEVCVNGRWIGHGPARSWPSLWSVDEYDLRGLLAPGRNVIAALVQDIGASTFQYIYAAPGLIAQLDLPGRRIVSDRSWRCRPHEGYGWPVPRISIQEAWEEQFDARQEPGDDWKSVGFDDRQWPAAELVDPPHEALEERDIPMLTREPVAPVRLVSAQAVRPCPYTWSLNPRELLRPRDRGDDLLRGRLLLATHIHSDRPQAVQFHEPHGRRAAWKLNGRDLTFDDHSLQLTAAGVANARLRKGWNTLLCALPELTNAAWIVINAWTQRPVRFAARPVAPRSRKHPWLALGPFGPAQPAADPPWSPVNPELPTPHPDATPERYDAIWRRGTLTEADRGAPFARPLSPDLIAPTDVFAVCASERVEENRAVRVENASALLTDNAEWSTVHPPKGDADVRLLLDFGREVIGYHDFEVDAAGGTVLDFHSFEFIQRDDRINLAEGMNNTFRYVCREGVQRYRTFVRRGLRYTWLTLRNFRRPVRIRFVRLLMSTYPIDGQGGFACSDALLERMWHVGVHTVRCCAEDTYTDCPTYEQTLWVGDARNEALVDLVSSGDPRLSAHCWTLTARSLEREPIVESHVPSGCGGIIPAFSMLWMRWAHEHFMFTGDRALARRMLAWIDRNVRGIQQHVNAKGLFEIKAWNLCDWAPLDTPDQGIVTHQNCWAVLALRQAADMARRLGQRARAERWTALADDLSRAINRHLWSDERRAYVDSIHADGTPSTVLSQQTQTTAYVSGVASGKRAGRCIEIIESPPPGFVTSGSPFFMFFVLEAIVRAGHYEKMLEVIRRYWGPQIEAGATSFWETYHAGAGRLTRSHCHGWSSAPTFFLTQHVLGVQPLEPGYAIARIAPQPGDLSWAQGRVPTPRGAIECRWSREEGDFALEASLPPKTSARIELPFGGRPNVEQGRAVRLQSPRGTIHLDFPGPILKLTVEH